MRLIIWFVFGCASVVVSASNHGITVFAPRKIRPNREFSVAIGNAGNQDVQFEVSLTGPNMDDSADTTVERQSSTLASFQVGNVRQGEKFQLKVASTNSAVFFKEEIDLDVAVKTMSILILTDKPVYKPGDILRFRVILFDINLMPVSRIRTVDVRLQDEDNNLVGKWAKAKLRNGMFEAGLLLASSPILGNWTLTVKAVDRSNIQEEKKTIKVEKYTLPPFSVNVHPTHTITPKDTTIQLSVESLYSFTHPVTGLAVVQLYLTDSRFKPDLSKEVNINGKVDIKFDLDKSIDIDKDEDTKEISVHLSITDTFTNVTVSKEQPIFVYKYPFKVSLRRSSLRFTAGLPYEADIIVYHNNGKPYSSFLNESFELKVEYDGNESSPNYVVDKLDDNGIKRVTFHPPSGTEQITVKVLHVSGYELDLAKISAQHQGIQIIPKKYNRYIVNQAVDFTVECTESINLLSYFIMARGNIILAESVNVRGKNKYTLSINKLTSEMVPFATLLVYYINEGGIVVYDNYEIVFEALNNNFKFRTDENEYKIGSTMSVEATAADDSDVILYAIDRSSLSLEHDGHNFYKKDVLDQYREMIGTEANANDHIQTLGLFFKSTAQKQPDTSKLKRSGRSATYTGRARPVVLRTNFPEVWLWDSFSMDNEKYRASGYTVPDSVTSWQVTGYAISPTQGLGVVSQPTEIAVKKSFYVKATLPYSIKRDEVTVIQVMVFNFLGNDTSSNVILYSKSNEIEFVGGDSSADETFRMKTVLVPSNSGKATSFLIRAKTLGEISIKIIAESPLESDGVEHILRVVPESFEEEEIHGRFITNAEFTTSIFALSLDIPRNVENNSVQIKFELDPDILGIASSNLEDLTKIPKESGEQNMLNFVPHVAILDLLKSSAIEATPELKTKITNYVSSGYQNQLKYKYSNGAFRDFASSKASTFLTAQVAMSLKAADKHIKDIDKAVVDKAFEWLASLQKSDGSFEEVGDVFNQAMQGKQNTKKISLTAFVLVAFLESEDIKTKHASVINKASKHLADNFNSISDTYDLAVATYALSMQNHRDKEKFLNKFVETSQLDESGRYWSAGKLSVEITAFGLLSYLEQKLYSDAINVTRWLNLKREAPGAFANIQDTFIGLKALAKATEFMTQKQNEYKVIISYDDKVAGNRNSNKKSIPLPIDKHQLKMFAYELPSTVRSVDIKIVGKGFGFFQLHSRYAKNVLNVNEGKKRFEIDVKVNNSTSTIHKYNLEVCIAYNAPERFAQTDKTMVEVFFPSGLAAAKDDVQDLSNSIKHIENRFGDTSLVIYYQSLGEMRKCFKVTAKRRFQVASHRPAYIMVYNVNNRKEFGIQEYAGPQMKLCDICEGEDCKQLRCK